jgi:hypothetical protein
MGVLTATHVFTAESIEEYNAAVAKLDLYEANPENHPLTSRVDDPDNLTITYSASHVQEP